MGNSRVRLSRAVVLVCATALVVTGSSQAEAFNLKHTQSGLDVRWAVPHIDFVIDSQLSDAVAGGADAVASAAQSWSGVAGAPSISANPGAVGSMPAVDQQNSVLFLHNFAAANGALAVTIVTADESTGFIVDTDIVINADHAFAVLPSGARASSSSPLVSTEGSSNDTSSQAFDLAHVAAHEVGHALGLADESGNAAALMYPYTRAGDASVRTPGSDDLSGIDQDYAGADLSSGSAQGCGGGASVAGRRATNASWPTALVLIGAGGWLVSRRRRQGLAPRAMAFAILVAGSGQAHSASASSFDATARVTAVTTRIVDGVFQTTLELVPRCRTQICPAHALAQVWGGTIDGIRQQVGENAVPTLNDDVDVAFRAPDEGQFATTTAVVLTLRSRGTRLPQVD